MPQREVAFSAMRFLPCYTMTLLRLRIIVGDARIRTRNLWCITMSHNISQVYVQYIMSSFRKINCKKLKNFCCFYLCQVSGVGTAAQTFQTTYNIYCSLEEINIFYKFAKFSTLAPQLLTWRLPEEDFLQISSSNTGSMSMLQHPYFNF